MDSMPHSAGAIHDLMVALGYGPLRRQGANLVGYCQIHGEIPGNSRPSFSIRFDNGIYQCFSCGAKGRLSRLMQESGMTLPAGLTQQIREMQEEHAEMRKISPRSPARAGWVGQPLPEALLWALPSSGPGVDQLIRAGFRADLLADLGVREDTVKGRVVYPLRDLSGKLCAMIGRATDPRDAIGAKYKVYTEEIGEMCRAWSVAFPWQDYRPHSHDFVWLLHEEMPPPDTAPEDAPLLVVEGFKVAMWALQAGMPRGSVCALMGSSATDAQIRQMERTGRPLVLALDNDSAGRKGTRALVEVLNQQIMLLQYPGGKKQLDDYTLDEAREILAPYVPRPRAVSRKENREFQRLLEESRATRPTDGIAPPVQRKHMTEHT